MSRSSAAAAATWVNADRVAAPSAVRWSRVLKDSSWVTVSDRAASPSNTGVKVRRTVSGFRPLPVACRMLGTHSRASSTRAAATSMSLEGYLPLVLSSTVLRMDSRPSLAFWSSLSLARPSASPGARV